MKKNLTIISLILFTILSLFYGYVKASEAEKNLLIARQNGEEVKKQTELATVYAAKAQAQAAIAKEIMEQLQQCQSK